MSEHTLVRLPAIIFYTIPELIFCRDLLWEDLQVDSVEQGTRNKLDSPGPQTAPAPARARHHALLPLSIAMC